MESISANEMADQDNEPNSGMLTIAEAWSQLAMNERISILIEKKNVTFPNRFKEMCLSKEENTALL